MYRAAGSQPLLDGRPAARLVFLDVPHDLDVAQLTARPGHFFPATLAGSQFDDLEVPGPAESALVIPAVGTPEELVAAIIASLHLVATAE